MNENIILEYEGVLTQEIISKNISIVEDNIENMGMMGKVVTTAVELSQNMMEYSKSSDINSDDINPAGFIKITSKDDIYYISSKNIVNIDDKQRIEPRLIEVQSLDASGIKKRYKELRRSGANAHDNNGGIGFFEIGKQVTKFDYSFEPINEERFYYIFDAVIEPRRK